MSVDHYTYRVTWSPEDGEHVGSMCGISLPVLVGNSPGGDIIRNSANSCRSGSRYASQ